MGGFGSLFEEQETETRVVGWADGKAETKTPIPVPGSFQVSPGRAA